MYQPQLVVETLAVVMLVVVLVAMVALVAPGGQLHLLVLLARFPYSLMTLPPGLLPHRGSPSHPVALPFGYATCMLHYGSPGLASYVLRRNPGNLL